MKETNSQTLTGPNVPIRARLAQSIPQIMKLCVYSFHVKYVLLLTPIFFVLFKVETGNMVTLTGEIGPLTWDMAPLGVVGPLLGAVVPLAGVDPLRIHGLGDEVGATKVFQVCDY